MRLQTLLAMLLVPVVGACTYGIRPNAVPFATTAGGANVTYWVKGDPVKRHGEIFAVNDSDSPTGAWRSRRATGA